MLDLIFSISFWIAKVSLGLFIGCVILMFVYYGTLIVVVDPIYFMANKKHLKSWNDIWEEAKDIWSQR